MAIAIDTEARLATNASPVPELVCVSIAWGERGCSFCAGAGPCGCGVEGSSLLHTHDPALERALAWAFAQPVIAFANAPFDVYVLLRRFPALLPAIANAYAEGRIVDVLTREKLIDIAEGQHFRRGKYGLGDVGRRHGIELNKDDPWRKRYGELIGFPVEQWPEGARRYAIADGEGTLAIYHDQEQFRAAHELDVFADAANQARGHLALYAQTLRGLRTDAAEVEAIDRRMLREIQAHALACVASGLARIEGKKAPKIKRKQAPAKALIERHCAELKIRPHRTDPSSKHPNGAIQLSDDAMTHARIPEGHPLDHYRQLGAKETLRSKTIPVLRHPLIRTRYDECVGSGRTSSSGFDSDEADGWIGTNMQNQPREGGFRECLIPPPGHLFVISDWSGAELVTLAQVQITLFGRSALADMLRQGRDPHAEFAASMFGIPLAEVTKKQRQAAKPFNFGKPGGMGRARFIAYALSDYGVTITDKQEREFTARWHAMFPEMQLFFDYVQSLQGADGYITVVQPWSRRIRGKLRFPDACNTHFQGLAADAAKLALWWLWLAGLDPTSPLYGGPPIVDATGNLPSTGQVLFVHDENVTVVRAELAEAAKVEQERIMIEAFRVVCPDVPIKVESVIAERYKK